MKNLKEYVREQYSKVVSTEKTSSAYCSTTCCQEGFNESYEHLEGYDPNADYSLGCGLPTQFAKIKKGLTVLDLGSGAGNDCFVARAEVGELGKVIGLDFSEAMVEKARENSSKLNYSNVEFIVGDIEEMPIQNNSVDIVISNCVLNLVPNKKKVFSNIYRVLKVGGHFSISDVITTTTVPQEMKRDLNLLSDCISGATPKNEYLKAIETAGFKNIIIQKERELTMPKQAKQEYNFPPGFKILSLTIFAVKF